MIKRAIGLEPTTFTLAKGKRGDVTAETPRLTADDATACTSACTSEGEKGANPANKLEVIAELPADLPADQRALTPCPGRAYNRRAVLAALKSRAQADASSAGKYCSSSKRDAEVPLRARQCGPCPRGAGPLI